MELSDLHKSKQGSATNLNTFPLKMKTVLFNWVLNPLHTVFLGISSTTELPKTAQWLVQIKAMV